jgi:hypothetical protein
MTTANQTRREVMVLAWGKFRYEAHRATGFTFAAALRHAWAWIKGAAARATAALAWAAIPAKRVLHLRSVVRSPIDRSLAGGAHAGTLAFKAAYTTARVGA